MHKIEFSLKEFIIALEQKKCIALSNDGWWHFLDKFEFWRTSLLKNEEKNLLELIHAFIICFDRLEKKPVRLKNKNGKKVVQPADFSQWLLASKTLIMHLEAYPYPTIKKFLNLLRQREIALLYRLERENDGLNRQVVEIPLLHKLCEIAKEWKREQKIFWNVNLSRHDAERLEETCHYPEFVRLLLMDQDLANEFLGWVLREGNDPIPYIQFPYFKTVIVDCHLDGRIGRLGGNHLKVLKQQNAEGVIEKALTLTIQGENVSILNEDLPITFKGNYKLTVKQILQIFKEKSLQVGNLEFFGEGIINWNAHCLGWWNADKQKYEVIDLSQAEWWKQLPLFEVLSIKQARNRYKVNLDGKVWNLVAKASREHLTLDFDKTHAYLEILIPLNSNHYAVYDFGKFAVKYPANYWETMRTVTVSVQATIAYPDENVYYTHRQHVGYSFPLAPEKGLKYMDSIKDDMVCSREGNVVFQIESENCGKWIQTRLEEHLGEEKVPNLYRMPLINTEPEGTLAWIWHVIRLFPKSWQSRILAICHLPLRPWKGCWIVDKKGRKVWKSLTASSYWEDGIVYLPAFLHTQGGFEVLQEEPGHQTRYLSGKVEAGKNLESKVDPFESLDMFQKSA